MKVCIGKKALITLRALARESGEAQKSTLEKLIRREYEGRQKFKITFSPHGLVGRLDDLR